VERSSVHNHQAPPEKSGGALPFYIELHLRVFELHFGLALTCPNGCDAGWFCEVEAQIRRTVSIHEDGSVFVAPGPPYEVEEIGVEWPVFV
jgi:hypothetical protein